MSVETHLSGKAKTAASEGKDSEQELSFPEAVPKHDSFLALWRSSYGLGGAKEMAADVFGGGSKQLPRSLHVMTGPAQQMWARGNISGKRNGTPLFLDAARS